MTAHELLSYFFEVSGGTLFVLAGIRCQGLRGLPLDMSRIHPECPGSGPSDRLVVADVLLRQEPAEEEDEEEDEGDGKEDDEDADEDDDGYSE
jgi:hypothetical protein